jgi:hypothetical protein
MVKVSRKPTLANATAMTRCFIDRAGSFRPEDFLAAPRIVPEGTPRS